MPFGDYIADILRERLSSRPRPRARTGVTGTWTPSAPTPPQPPAPPNFSAEEDAAPQPSVGRPAGSAPQPTPQPQAAPVAGTVDPMQQQYMDLLRGQQDQEKQMAAGSMELTGLDEERGLYDQDFQLADREAETALPGMRNVGRVSVAANPLEFIGAAAKQIRGRKDRDAARAGIEGVNKRAKSGRDRIISILSGNADRFDPPSNR